MLVTPKKQNQTSTPRFDSLLAGKFRGTLFSIFAGLFVIAVLLFLLKGQFKDHVFQWADSKGFGYIQKDYRMRDALIKAPTNYASSSVLPKLVVDIKFKHMQKIFKKRTEALEKKFLVQGKDDFVPVSIRIEGIDNKIKAKVRLKGDHVDHLKGNKWSFRVHTKGKHHFTGLRRFSIQHPKTRGFQQEALFFEFLRQLGLLAPRYSFVDLTINGKNIGVMAMEEHFSKEILESNGRKEGVIVRYDESHVFDARDGFERRMGLVGGAFDSYKNTSIDAFGTSKVLASKRLSRDYRYAVGMLRGFTQGTMKASEVFDAKQIGKLAAAADLWGTWHVLVWRNIRFYLNPITMKLEPIAYDANHDERKAAGELVSRKSQLFATLLKDPEIFKHYKTAVLDLANQVSRGQLIETLKAKEAVLLKQLYNEYYMLPSINFDTFKKQASYMSTFDYANYKPIDYYFSDALKIDDIRDIDYPRILHAYIVNDAGTTFEMAAAVPHDIEIVNIQLKAKSNKFPDIKLPGLVEKLPISLAALEKGKVPDFQSFTLPNNPDANKYNLEIAAKIKGYSKTYVLNAMSYFPVISKNPVLTSTIQEQTRKHKFLQVDSNNNTVTITQPLVEVNESIVIPAEYKLHIGKGVKMKFSEDAILVSYGAVEMLGTATEPIILQSKVNKGGKSPTWQGMVVMYATGESRLEFVEFRNTKGILQEGWQLTGGVTFFESDVNLNNSRFIGNEGEDALNIIHSNFEINDIHIEKTASDGFDADFSDGKFTNGLFRDIGLLGGGDGIDISGSNIVVNGTEFMDVSDKSLSVGEKSQMVVNGVKIRRSGTGAACKDGSILEIRNSYFEDIATVGLMAYIKKPEYGGASIIAEGNTFNAPVIPARAQISNKIIINGSPIQVENINVKEMYKSIMKPGLRR